ncbi:MAG: cytidine deaminase [Chlorobi bacterium]|nr:cytidine deaminase [Chlorobiota bacterium]
MKSYKVITPYIEYNFEELSDDEKQLIKEAKESAVNAYAPYSQFLVGCAVLLENGKTVTGNNQENAAYPSGLCAERVAIFYANSKYPNVPVLKLATAVFSKSEFLDEPIPPCGSCRQVLLETELRFKIPIKIILAGKEKIRVIENAKSLLPLNFDNEYLT